MNIGILFPRSNTYPLIGADFLEGLKTYLKKEGLDNEVGISAESVGFGGAEKEVYAKAEKLLMIDDVDILIGFIDEKILELVKPLVLASGKLFIMVNPGANHPVNWVPQSNIITLGLQHSFLCALSGFAAGSSGPGVRAAVASAFYDCGYLHLASMVKEFQAMKGQVAFNYVNKQLYNDEFSITELTNFLLGDKSTRTLLCVFDSLPAGLLYQLLNNYEGSGQLNLYVSPMMLEKKALERIDSSNKLFIQGYMPWHITVPGEGNKLFSNHYLQQLKKEPGIFSLLGWEAGIVLKEITDLVKEDYRNGELIVQKLQTTEIKGPRGTLKLDPGTQYFLSPAIKCTIAAGTNQTEFEYDINVENQWEEFSERPTEGVVSGWTNTYLCY